MPERHWVEDAAGGPEPERVWRGSGGNEAQPCRTPGWTEDPQAWRGLVPRKHVECAMGIEHMPPPWGSILPGRRALWSFEEDWAAELPALEEEGRRGPGIPLGPSHQRSLSSLSSQLSFPD